MEFDQIISELNENHLFVSLLKAHSFGKEMNFSYQIPTFEHLQECRKNESLDNLLKEPLASRFLKFFLQECQCNELMLFIEDLQVFLSCPCRIYQKKLAFKIYNKYLSPSSQMCIGYPQHQSIIDQLSLSSLSISEEKEKYNDTSVNIHIFNDVKQFIYRFLSFSILPSFIYSLYYSRLVSFRLYEKEEISINHFEFIRLMGQGGFAKVYAVLKKDTYTLYACKMFEISLLEQKKRYHYLLNEKKALSQISSPFIINLKYSFYDNTRFYLIVDLMSGGDLQYHLKHFKFFPERWVCFYSAIIILALEDIHNQGFVYRDLKPENVMLDDFGYPHLTDLGLCIEKEYNTPLTSHCGTKKYMAPEQHHSVYDHSVDLWALGITMYCLLTGTNPFDRKSKMLEYEKLDQDDNKLKIEVKPHKRRSTGSNKDPHNVNNKDKTSLKLIESKLPNESSSSHSNKNSIPPKYIRRRSDKGVISSQISDKEKKVINYNMKTLSRIQNLKWPNDVSEACKDLICRLLIMEPKYRLGYNSKDELKQHPFFSSLSWPLLERKHMSPPFVPNPSTVHASYLEAVYQRNEHEEDLIIEQKAENLNIFNHWNYIKKHIYQEEIIQTSTSPYYYLNQNDFKSKDFVRNK